MSVAENLEGVELPASKQRGVWKVIQKLTRTSTSSGSCTSAGYRVRHSNGHEAFLKAADMNLTTEGNDLLAKLTALTEMQKFERAILNYCHGNNMDRVVTPLDYGDMLIEHDKIKEPLFWIVFELAKCDSRIQINQFSRFDFCWSLTALHNLAIAVSQLHTALVSHNDIRPSKFLVFDELRQKLSDLESAISPKFPALHDGNICIGDPRYAAPEIIYSEGDHRNIADIDFQRRRASDLYLLGSMGYFFVTGNMMTPQITSRLLPPHRPESAGSGWSGDFVGVLPYLRDGFTSALYELERALPQKDTNQLTETGQQFLAAICQLCEPDPLLRGHPMERTEGHDRYSVRRYISLFNRLRLISLN